MRAALVALVLLASPAIARDNHAILIGASTYPGLEERYWLKGPANDVTLVQTYLTTAAPVAFASENVTVLADGVTTAPTLTAIRTAFAALTARVAPGDFVYLHFSGHGTQAPALNPDAELDGLDELFLPTDIGPWSDEVGAVRNGLVDDEIGTMIDALRAKGVDVWAVFDSCHSGTVTRAAPSDEEVRTRQLPPDALGLPDDAQTRSLDDPRAAPEAPVDVADEPGSFVAFYAAQTNEVTPEKNLPKNKPGRVPQGVFTYALMEVLAEYPAATYGQIGQEVLRKYATKSLARSTPMFEGDLDRVAFSGTPGERVAQWAAKRDGDSFTLPAGTLHGLTKGEVLAVMASAADETSAALGYVQIATADTFTATATPVVQDGQTLPSELPKGLTLRRISAEIDYTLTVALPEPGSAPADALTAAMTALTEASGPRLAYVAAGEPADLTLAVLPDSPRPDAIWVLPGTGLADTDYASLPSITTVDKDAETLGLTLADTLGTMARAINLL
ncbi:MAG: caspase family protein, partial [Paracoccaceae bacterium]